MQASQCTDWPSVSGMWSRCWKDWRTSDSVLLIATSMFLWSRLLCNSDSCPPMTDSERLTPWFLLAPFSSQFWRNPDTGINQTTWSVIGHMVGSISHGGWCHQIQHRQPRNEWEASFVPLPASDKGGFRLLFESPAWPGREGEEEEGCVSDAQSCSRNSSLCDLHCEQKWPISHRERWWSH